jgi:hypothetical protein
MSLRAPMTIETLARDTVDEPSGHLRRLDGHADVKPWLETMWGIRRGQSAPMCQLITSGLAPELELWLRRLWGLGPAFVQPAGGRRS